MPPFNNLQSQNGIPSVVRSMPAVRAFPTLSPDQADQYFSITGVTRDSTGAVLGLVTVYLFEMVGGTPLLTKQVISDASGNYTFTVGDPTRSYWTVTYKAGAPDVAGASVNTLVGI